MHPYAALVNRLGHYLSIFGENYRMARRVVFIECFYKVFLLVFSIVLTSRYPVVNAFNRKN